MNPEKFKFVVLKEISDNPFDHFISVQGKLDGDQNAGVFAELPEQLLRNLLMSDRKLLRVRS